jgi:hypothetical protein
MRQEAAVPGAKVSGTGGVRNGEWLPLPSGDALSSSWLTDAVDGWSVQGNAIRMTGPGTLYTRASLGDVAYALRVTPGQAGSVFGVVPRAWSEHSALKLEFDGRQALVQWNGGSRSVPYAWGAGITRELGLIVADGKLRVYADRRKLCELEDAALRVPGRFGIYRKSGAVEFRSIHLRPMD